MTTLTLFNLFNYFQRNFKWDDSSLTLLVQTFKNLTSNPEKSMDILYPAQTPITDPKVFFATPNQIEKLKKLSQERLVTPRYRAPREPIVLCHGLFGFDVRGPKNIPLLQFHYWSGVEDALAKLGAKIIVTRVPQAGSIWERSNTLHTILESILANKKVNFVAHSMGGLDCRYLLANIKNRSYQVQSLSTVCTPHRGSPIMDWFRDNFGLGQPKTTHEFDSPQWATLGQSVMSSSTNTNKRESLKTLIEWLDEPAYAHLTTDFCNHYFNPNTPDDPRVAYYSYGASAQLPAWSSLLGLPYQMVHEKEGENDGIVSIKSAKWGTYVKTIEADHWDFSGKSMIPYRLRTSKDFDRLEFYAEMATQLYDQGH